MQWSRLSQASEKVQETYGVVLPRTLCIRVLDQKYSCVEEGVLQQNHNRRPSGQDKTKEEMKFQSTMLKQSTSFVDLKCTMFFSYEEY